MCRPQKQVKTQTSFWTALFHDKFTLWHIKQATYTKKNKFTSYEQYLLRIKQATYIKKNKFISYEQYLFGFLFFEKQKKTRIDQSTL